MAQLEYIERKIANKMTEWNIILAGIMGSLALGTVLCSYTYYNPDPSKRFIQIELLWVGLGIGILLYLIIWAFFNFMAKERENTRRLMRTMNIVQIDASKRC